MKRLLLAACLGALLVVGGSCNKHTSSSMVGTSSSIVGTWEIRAAQNGMTPTITYPLGNDSLLKFTETNYSVYSRGQVVRSGTYMIVEDLSFDALVVPAGQFTHRIIYDGIDNARKIFLQVSGNTLTFLSGSFALDSGSDVVYGRL